MNEKEAVRRMSSKGPKIQEKRSRGKAGEELIDKMIRC